MVKTVFFILLSLLLICCNQEKAKAENTDVVYAISTENWPKKANVNPKSAKILEDWNEFKEFDLAFDAIYTVENRDDLNLVVENLIEKQNQLSASVYPAEFDKPQVKSRQKVLHTFILKIKGHQEYRLDPKEPVLEMITAYSTLLEQFDIITNNTLDIKSLLKEH